MKLKLIFGLLIVSTLSILFSSNHLDFLKDQKMTGERKSENISKLPTKKKVSKIKIIKTKKKKARSAKKKISKNKIKKTNKVLNKKETVITKQLDKQELNYEDTEDYDSSEIAMDYDLFGESDEIELDLDECERIKEDDKNKVVVCHFPPKNPAAVHSICISKKEWENDHKHHEAKKGNQDHIGPCTIDELERIGNNFDVVKI